MPPSKQVDQLVDIIDYDIKNLIFEKPVECKVPNSTLTYRRIPIRTKNTDGTIGGLYLKLPQMFCFGVSENKAMDDPNKVTGHTVTHAIRSKDGATPEELKTEQTIRNIVKECCNNLREQVKLKTIQLKKDIAEPKIKELEKKVLYQKRDEDSGDVIDPNVGPTFSPKLTETKDKKDPKTGIIKPGKIITMFYHSEDVDEKGESLELNPLDFLSDKQTKKYFKSESVIKIEDIYTASDKCSITIKLTEANIETIGSKQPRLLNKKKTFVRKSDDEDKQNRLLESEPEIKLEDEDEDEPEEKPVVKTPPKKEKKKKDKKEKKKKSSDDEEEDEA